MVKHGEAGFSVFVGLTGSSQELGLEATNYFVYPGNNLDEMYVRLHLRHASLSVKEINSWVVAQQMLRVLSADPRRAVMWLWQVFAARIAQTQPQPLRLSAE